MLDRNYGCEYGEVAEVTRNSLIIQTGIGALSVKSVQLEGRETYGYFSFPGMAIPLKKAPAWILRMKQMNNKSDNKNE